MPAQGGHFDRSNPELLLGFGSFGSRLFCFLGSSGGSFFFFSFLGGSGFFFFGFLGCSSFFSFGSFSSSGFVFLGRWGCCGGWGCRRSWGCSSGWLGSSSHWRASVAGGKSAGGEQGGNQYSEDFVHLEFPEITLLEKMPPKKLVDCTVTKTLSPRLTRGLDKFRKIDLRLEFRGFYLTAESGVFC